MSLPFVFKIYGVYLGCLIFLIAWWFTSFNCYFLLRSKNLTRTYDYIALARKSYGYVGEKIV